MLLFFLLAVVNSVVNVTHLVETCYSFILVYFFVSLLYMPIVIKAMRKMH